MTACRSAAKFYTGVHGDLLIAGAVLHDIGKLEAYDYDKATGAIRISKKGVLTDHIIIGVDMFRRAPMRALPAVLSSPVHGRASTRYAWST